MRKIREVLRLDAAGLSKRRIAAGLNIGATSAGDYLRRARLAGLGWPFARRFERRDPGTAAVSTTNAGFSRSPATSRLAGVAPRTQATRRDSIAVVGGIPLGSFRGLRLNLTMRNGSLYCSIAKRPNVTTDA